MELIPNWDEVLKRAHSVKFMGLAAALEAAQQLLPFVADYLPWYVPVLIILAGIGARVVQQKELAE